MTPKQYKFKPKIKTLYSITLLDLIPTFFQICDSMNESYFLPGTWKNDLEAQFPIEKCSMLPFFSPHDIFFVIPFILKVISRNIRPVSWSNRRKPGSETLPGEAVIQSGLINR